MSAVACGKCGKTGTREGTALPVGWEPYRAGEYNGAVWCGVCVDSLLEQLAASLRLSTPARWHR